MPYEPAVVTLDGVVGTQRWYGFPNFGRWRPEHDMIETVPFLYLNHSIRVTVDTFIKSNVWKLELETYGLPGLTRLLMRSSGRRVRVVGSLSDADLPSDRTPVVFRVRSVTFLPGRSQANPGAARGVGDRVLNGRRVYDHDPELPPSHWPVDN
jgi:hypothetical protein